MFARVEKLPLIGSLIRKMADTTDPSNHNSAQQEWLEYALNKRDHLHTGEVVIDQIFELEHVGNHVLLREFNDGFFLRYELWSTNTQGEARGVRTTFSGVTREGGISIDITSGNGWKFFTTNEVNRANIRDLLKDGIANAQPDIDYRNEDEGEILYETGKEALKPVFTK